MRFTLFLCLLALIAPLARAEGPRAGQGKERIRAALHALGASKEGQKLVTLAEKTLPDWRNEALLNRINWASVTKTEVEVSRTLHPTTGKETKKETRTILLRPRADSWDLVLDLAHELAHFSVLNRLDPYDPSLTLVRHIEQGIEGEGGEADAIAWECRIAHEIAPQATVARRCPSDWTSDKEHLIEALYRSGGDALPLRARLQAQGEELKRLREEPPVFHSVSGRAPYPVALSREYDVLREKVCANARARSEALKRGPASIKKREDELIRMRCGAS